MRALTMFDLTTVSLALVASLVLSVNGVNFTAQQLTPSDDGKTEGGVWELQEAQRLLNEKNASLESMTKEVAKVMGAAEAQSLLQQLGGFRDEMSAGIHVSDWQRVWEGNRQFDNHTGLFWKALDAVQVRNDSDVREAAPDAAPESKAQERPEDTEQRRKDAERQMKDHEKNHANRERELKQNFKKSTIDTTTVRAALDAWRQANANLRSILASGDLESFWDANADMSDHYTTAVQDAFQALYDGQTYANLAGRFADVKRQLKQMQNELKRVGKDVKGASEFAALEEFVKMYADYLTVADTQYQSLAGADPEAIRAFAADFNEKTDPRDFYDKLQDVNDLANTQRMTKEAQRWPKEAERNYKNMSRECKRTKCKGKAAEGTLSAYKSLIEQLKAAVAQKDPETASDIKSDLDELNNTFWEQMQEMYVKTDLANLNRTATGIGRMLQEAQREARRGAKGKISASALQAIESSVAEFTAAVETANAAFKAGNIDEARDAKDEAVSISNDLQELFAPLRERGDDDDGPGDISEILQDIAIGLKNIDAAPTKANASLCRDLLNKGSAIILEFQKTGNEDLMAALQPIGDAVDAQCDAFMPPED